MTHHFRVLFSLTLYTLSMTCSKIANQKLKNESFPLCCYLVLPWKLVVWATSFRLGHSPVQAVHLMQCTAQTGEWPNLKEVTQTTNFCGTCFTGTAPKIGT